MVDAVDAAALVAGVAAVVGASLRAGTVPENKNTRSYPHPSTCTKTIWKHIWHGSGTALNHYLSWGSPETLQLPVLTGDNLLGQL